ncbi:MAG: SRPBCC family protein [Solirubrobacteraceae bacterium]|nr:SRPBCC family protein [Solirubrobacteraceae bacterium]
MAEFALERSTTISAPAAAIYPLLADFHEWPKWSPWEDLDPALARTYSGAESGTGAVYEWSGNRKAGQGRMEILDAAAPSKVVIDLRFLKPFKARNTTTFTVEEAGATTTVRWEMRGPKTTVMKILGGVLGIEKSIAKDFDKGLAALKTVAEKPTV